MKRPVIPTETVLTKARLLAAIRHEQTLQRRRRQAQEQAAVTRRKSAPRRQPQRDRFPQN